MGMASVDASIVVIKDGVFTVKSTAGNTDLGGDEFTNRLIDCCAAEMKKKHDTDLFSQPDALANISAFCEIAKSSLSLVGPSISTQSMGISPDFEITRVSFEELCAHLFHSVMGLVEACLRDASMEKSDIDDVLVVGGYAKMPRMRQLLSDLFPGKELQSASIAKGAAAQASIVSGEMQEVSLHDVSTRSIVVEIDGHMSFLIKRNTPLPAETAFFIKGDTRSTHTVKVYEGESTVLMESSLLGVFLVHVPTGNTNIEVIFKLDLYD
ncbi:hypothetical protein PFISCL1PPCAC_18369 [Pristionchus fissidentatus]|uniref:Uncharacterized protein n=1 Tax=Pristionchus fissidentatus TaxID=1538716 RepID=A0AAV5WAM9_9BILA|nr:hypothetical protein PFISCL1PPCAC_18369 [Pristionchus fissidentatus]